MPVYCGEPTADFIPAAPSGVITSAILENPEIAEQTVLVQRDDSDSVDTKGNEKTSRGGDRRSHELEKHFGLICDLIQEHGYWISHRKLCAIFNERTGEEFDHSAIKRFREKHNLPRNTQQGVAGIITNELIVPGQQVSHWKFEADIVKMKAMVANGERLDVSKFRYQEKRKHFIWDIDSGRLTFTQALKKHHVPKSTGSGWWHDFRHHKRLGPLPRQGKRVPDLTPYHNSIQAKAKLNHQMTPADFITWLEAEHNVSCSLTQMKKTLKALGIGGRLKKAKPTQPEVSVALPESITLSDEQIVDYDARAEKVDEASTIGKQLAENIKRTIIHEVQEDIKLLEESCSVFTNPFNRNAVCNNHVGMLYMLNLGYLSGAENLKAIARFIFIKFAMISALLGDHAPKKPPKQSTLNKFMRSLNPNEYSRFFIHYTKRCRERLSKICRDWWYGFDGKGLRGSQKGPNKDPVYIASIMGHTTRETVAVFPSGPLAKETKALMHQIRADELPPEYLKITADALNCKTALAKLFRERDGSYCWAVRGNNKKLKNWIKELFSDYSNNDIEWYYEHDEKHNKMRITGIITIPPELPKPPKWEDVQTIVAYATADIVDDKKLADFELKSPCNQKKVFPISMASIPIRHFISNERLSASMACHLNNQHWGIEENHHILDTTFQEDTQQITNLTTVYIATGERRRAHNPLMRLDSEDTTPGDQYWTLDSWHLLAAQTNICEKYPQFKEFFQFK